MKTQKEWYRVEWYHNYQWRMDWPSKNYSTYAEAEKAKMEMIEKNPNLKVRVYSFDSDMVRGDK